MSALFEAAIAPGSHLFPFRTEQLSPVAPMVLHTRGRVGRRHFTDWRVSEAGLRKPSFFCVLASKKSSAPAYPFSFAEAAGGPPAGDRPFSWLCSGFVFRNGSVVTASPDGAGRLAGVMEKPADMSVSSMIF